MYPYADEADPDRSCEGCDRGCSDCSELPMYPACENCGDPLVLKVPGGPHCPWCLVDLLPVSWDTDADPAVEAIVRASYLDSVVMPRFVAAVAGNWGEP